MVPSKKKAPHHLFAVILILSSQINQAAGTSITPPQISDTKAAEFPGLHNVVTFSPGVYSGSAPEGDAGFDSLKALEIKTVISVDGALPEVEKAKKRKLRYVHIPIGYNGATEDQKLQIAKAIRDLDGPTYIHCHHGIHRSAGAAGAALVTLGKLKPNEAIQRMKVSGTDPQYKGLYRCSIEAQLVSKEILDAVDTTFPEKQIPRNIVQSMLEMDEVVDRLKKIEKANWNTPANQPDLIPASEVGRLADLLRNLNDDHDVKNKPAAFSDLLKKNVTEVQTLEYEILNNHPPKDLSRRWNSTQNSCLECHAQFRD